MTRLAPRWLRLPPLPVAASGETEVRPSRWQFRLEGFHWVVRQLGALFGILLSLAFLRGYMVFGVPPAEIVDKVIAAIEEEKASLEDSAAEGEGDGPVASVLRPLVSKVTVGQVVWALEGFAIAGFLVQLVVTGGLLRLGFRQRLFIVGDDSLRLRDGLWTVREQTFTVANIQNMVVRQGPLQRLLGIGDLEISTAGGGSSSSDDDEHGNLHRARLRGLDDPSALRDRLRRAVEMHRGSGLGDPDEPQPSTTTEADLAAAARALLAEARALRVAATGPGQRGVAPISG